MEENLNNRLYKLNAWPIICVIEIKWQIFSRGIPTFMLVVLRIVLRWQKNDVEIVLTE